MATHPTEPREYGDRELPSLIGRSAEPVVVESHFAGWAKPWRGLSAQGWSELLHEFGERINGARAETGSSREFAARYGLEIIPAVLVFSAGEVVARFTGSVSAAEVIDAVYAALRQAHALESASQELEAASAAKDVLSPVRSVLRRRTNEAQPLARAG